MFCAKKYTIAIFFGFLIGVFSGLVGVGGGEFRLPILIGLLKFAIPLATAINSIIGILVSIVAVICRYSLMVTSAYIVVLVMGVASLFGGYIGVHLNGKMKESLLRYLLIGFLTLVGINFICAPFWHSHIHVPVLAQDIKYALYIISGFVVGIFSGLFGVAGGEMRIPILIFVFDMPIKLAGTVSSFVALPAQIGGLIKHFKLRRINKENIVIAVTMGMSSVLGSLLGATLVFRINEKLLEFILGTVLIFSAFCLHKKEVRTNK